jgi:hypothetical protein
MAVLTRFCFHVLSSLTSSCQMSDHKSQATKRKRDEKNATQGSSRPAKRAKRRANPEPIPFDDMPLACDIVEVLNADEFLIADLVNIVADYAHPCCALVRGSRLPCEGMECNRCKGCTGVHCICIRCQDCCAEWNPETDCHCGGYWNGAPSFTLCDLCENCCPHHCYNCGGGEVHRDGDEWVCSDCDAREDQ